MPTLVVSDIHPGNGAALTPSPAAPCSRAPPSCAAPRRGPAPPLFARFTGLVLDPHPDGGATARLVERTEDGATHVHAEARVAPRS